MIMHLGKSLKHGHYKAFDTESYIELDDDKIQKRATFSGKEPYLIVYEKI